MLPDPFFDVTVLSNPPLPARSKMIIKLHRSEVVKATLNPDWRSFVLPTGPIGSVSARVFCVCGNAWATWKVDDAPPPPLSLPFFLMKFAVYHLWQKQINNYRWLGQSIQNYMLWLGQWWREWCYWDTHINIKRAHYGSIPVSYG